MKKYLAFLLAAITAASMVGCGSSPSSSPSPGSTSSPSSVAYSAPQDKPTVATVEEQVLYDMDGLRITATGLSFDGLMGPELKILIENGTDKDLTIQTRDAIVNGYMMEPLFSADIAAGKKVNDGIQFIQSSLDTCGIATIVDIGFKFHIFESSTWNNIADSDQLAIETSTKGTYVQEYNDSGTVLVDDGGIKIVYQGLDDGGLMGPKILLYLENNTDQSVTIQQRDLSINGFMIGGIISCDMVPGAKAVDDISLLGSALEENGIETLESGELKFHVFVTSSMKTLLDTDSIQLTFQ